MVKGYLLTGIDGAVRAYPRRSVKFVDIAESLVRPQPASLPRPIREDQNVLAHGFLSPPAAAKISD
jgi:hypothetical protein